MYVVREEHTLKGIKIRNKKLGYEKNYNCLTTNDKSGNQKKVKKANNMNWQKQHHTRIQKTKIKIVICQMIMYLFSHMVQTNSSQIKISKLGGERSRR